MSTDSNVKSKSVSKRLLTVIEKESFHDTTIPGEKKDLSTPMFNSYQPDGVESSWYSWWENQGYFKPSDDPSKKPFTIVIPPPNVTGSLHLGHALTNTIQDIIIRYKRMSGFAALWVPGTDHAGIATQTVVERMIKRTENKTRHDLGREEFVKRVWEWKHEYGSRIYQQLRLLGSSLDWSREVFTMDEVRSEAVQECFVRFAKEGLVYRAARLVNWDCTLRTAISDIEVDYITVEKPTKISVPGYEKKIEFGVLIEFAYKVVGFDEEVVVATTRIETMLVDTAVAVHPDDARYKHLHGKQVLHPFSGRELPIITDSELVDPEFGTGCVKITPAHDPNDFEVGQKHGLEMLNMLNNDGTLNSECGEFSGMKRFDARYAVINALEEKGLYRGKSANPMRLGICSRSNDVIEPVIRPQWFVDCKDMAREALEAVTSGDLEILPEEHIKTWNRWLGNIRDWCVSRQLWWGHRIPAYYVTLTTDASDAQEDPKRWVIAKDQEEANVKAVDLVESLGKTKQDIQSVVQDEDVLDTWFSSGLFPFAAFNWPNNTADLERFFPTSILETGHDILFFWVARMVMMSVKLTGKLPFSKVWLHAMVRDAHGRKMSKTLGNIIDPVDVIKGVTLEELHQKLHEGNLDPKEVQKAIKGQKADFPTGIPECGADALRFTLASYMSQGRDINLDVNRVVVFRNFCNKLWNATKFVMMNLKDSEETAFKPVLDNVYNQEGQSLAEKWILSKLSKALTSVNQNLDNFELGPASHSIHNWWLHELCDVFIEVSKGSPSKDVLFFCLENGLRMLHPFMPFVTEELWQRLLLLTDEDFREKQPESIMISEYPDALKFLNPHVEELMDLCIDIVHAIRSLRSSYTLKPSVKVDVYLVIGNGSPELVTEAVEQGVGVISSLGSASNVSIVEESNVPSSCGVTVVLTNVRVFVDLKGVIDPRQEIKKIDKKLNTVEKSLTSLRQKTSIPNYETKVPEKVRVMNAEKLEKLETEVASLSRSKLEFEKML
ncbi:hypothetical protein P9112_006017 [Eukaryota sp. TZLM1-RC]